MFHQDRSRLNRENVVLTREINDLRRKAKAVSLQQNRVERVRQAAIIRYRVIGRRTVSRECTSML